MAAASSPESSSNIQPSSAANGFAACLKILSELEAQRAEPKPVLHQLKIDLNYFRDQALREAQPETRASINRASVALRWEHFLLALEGSACRNRFLAETDWSVLERFAKSEARPQTQDEPIPRVGSELNWDVAKLFHHLVATIQRLPTPRNPERNLALIGLRYLIVESERPKAKRDRKWIACTWSAIHPILEAENLLAPFKSEQRVKERLRLFIRGE